MSKKLTAEEIKARRQKTYANRIARGQPKYYFVYQRGDEGRPPLESHVRNRRCKDCGAMVKPDSYWYCESHYREIPDDEMYEYFAKATVQIGEVK
jgi:hypothetical protein